MSVLPEYDHWLPNVWDEYIIDLVGWEDAGNWARLPATFRWHEFHQRLASAIEAAGPRQRILARFTRARTRQGDAQ